MGDSTRNPSTRRVSEGRSREGCGVVAVSREAAATPWVYPSFDSSGDKWV